jgi:hypothetical protein
MHVNFDACSAIANVTPDPAMSISTDLTRDRLGFIIECFGLVSGEELVDANAKVAACVNCRYQLWDFSKVTRVSVSADAVHRLALQDSQIPEWSALEKIAVVGTAESVAELTRIYELYSTAWIGRCREYQVCQFKSRREAEEWLEERLAAG